MEILIILGIIILLMEVMDAGNKKDNNKKKENSKCRLGRDGDVLIVVLQGAVSTSEIAGRIVYLIKKAYLPAVSEESFFLVTSFNNGISAVLLVGSERKEYGQIRIKGKLSEPLQALERAIEKNARKILDN